MEPYAMIQVSILLQQHRTVALLISYQAISVCFGGTLRFRGNPVEKHCCSVPLWFGVRFCAGV